MVRNAILAVAVPGVLAGILTIVASLLASRINADRRREWTAALLRNVSGAAAIGGGFLIAFWFIEGLPEFPPRERWHWLAFMAGAAAVFGCAHGLWARSRWGALVTGGMLAAVAGLMLHPLPGQEHHGFWKLALAATVGLVWLSTNALAKRRPGQTLPLAMMLIVSAAAVTLAEAGIAKFANMTGSLACMCGFIWVATALARRTPMAGGAIAVLAVMLPALMTMGHFYVTRYVPLASFAILALSPLALWLGELPLIDRWGGWRAWCVRAGIAVIVSGSAVIVAILNAPPPLEPYEW